MSCGPQPCSPIFGHSAQKRTQTRTPENVICHSIRLYLIQSDEPTGAKLQSPEGTTETLTNVASHSIYGCWASGTLLVAGPVDVEPSGMKRSSGVLVSM